MADWYVSSAAWAAIPQFAASGVYTVGNIVRPLTAPAFASQFAFRCTTAGTASTEPTWTSANNDGATVTTGGATFTNVSGRSAYGWSAAAGNLWCMTSQAGGANTRFSVGDRAFLSSDHSESATNATYAFTISGAYGVIQVISVNRAGSVPPASTDVLSGAILTDSGGFVLECYCNIYWQGITFSATNGNISFGNNGTKGNYLKNCALFINYAGSSALITANSASQVTLDNTTVQFSNAGQTITGNKNGFTSDVRWINTPSATLGTVPTNLFVNNVASAATLVTCRGVDLSAITTGLYSGTGGSPGKILFDSCRIASGVVRINTSGNVNTTDEVELVNCYDGTHFLAERHTPAGDLTTEFSTTLVGGAQDNVGLYSHKMISSVRSDDFAMPLEAFWMDVNNTLIGTSHTATVEIIGSASLNNNDIWLMLEYEGTAGSSLATLVTTQPAILATPTAVTSSSATWNSPPATPVTQHLQVTFTPQVAGRVRGQVRLGKPSTTVWYNPQIAIS